jgi:hypothetical protein
MNTKNLLFVTLAVILMAGCLFKSVHPFYSKDKIIYDSTLLGTWSDPDSGSWEFSQYLIRKGFMESNIPDNSYLLKLWDKKSNPSFFNVHLFELQGTKYLDFYPLLEKVVDDDFYSSHLLPLHSVAKLDMKADGTIHIRWYNEEWINKLIKENKTSISYDRVDNEGDTTLIITASTKDLQQFLLEHGNDTNAFKVEWMGQEKSKEAFSFILKKKFVEQK